MNPKKIGVAGTTPVTETWDDNRHNHYGCQGVTGQPLPFAPGAIVAGSGRSLSSASIKTRPAAERGGKEGHFYKPLTTQFRHDGFQYRQIAREGNAAIYEQRWIQSDGTLSDNVAYEVVKIRNREAFQIGGNYVEPAEIYPRPEAWGTDGFTYTDKDAAFNKFRQLSPAEPAKTNLEQTGDGLELRNKLEHN